MTPFKQAFRSLRQAPAFTLTVVATLAIGIGLNAAIFTVVDNVLLRPLGYHDADRIVAIRTHFNDEGRSIPRLGGDDYNDLARDVRGLDATAHFGSYAAGVILRGASFYIPIATVSPQFTEIMGVQPIAGRLFHPTDRVGTDVLLSAAFARDRFGSAAAALGQAVTFEGTLYTVAGVLPAGFSFPGKTDVWIEVPAQTSFTNRTAYNDQVVARRRAGVSTAQLSAELATFSARLQQSFPEDRHKSIEAVPLQEQLVGKVRPTLQLLMASVVVLLLIVCANLTHLQLVRATRQVRALSIRTALGASRRALAARALTETALLAIAGCLLALLLAVPALRLLTRIAPPDIPRLTEVHLNLDVLLFSGLVSLAVMLLATLLPLWRSWHVDPVSVLRGDSSRAAESRGSLRLRNALIVAETALTLTLSVAAILLTRQLIAQSRQDLGFAPEHLLTLDTHAVISTPERIPPDPPNPTPAIIAAHTARLHELMEARLARLDATLASVRAVPGVESAAAIYGAPMSEGGSNGNYAIKGRQVFAPSSTGLPHADFNPITPGFFTTLGVPLMRGRFFSADDRLGSPKVLLINDALASTQFPNQDPIGQQIATGLDESSTHFSMVVGVVGDIRSDSPAQPPSPTIYMPATQHGGWADDMQIVVRTPLPPAAMADTLRNALLRSHPEVAVKITTMRENVGEVERPEQFRTTLFTLFAAVSVLLAAIGMYGVTAYTVAQRRFEFGLRIALGATRPQVLGMVLGKALSVAALGIAAGIALSLGLVRFVASVVGKLPAFDPVAYALTSLGVLTIALLATLLPARRASSVEPMTVLRSE